MSMGISDKYSEMYLEELKKTKQGLEAEIEGIDILSEKYKNVIKQAEEYSEKLEAPVLAKISEVGYFCDAHVVRTNQITLELGANYFVECSLHTAKKILNRRIAELQKSKEGGLDGIRMVEEKERFMRESLVQEKSEEIVEEYNEESEKAFYERRKQRRIEKALVGVQKKSDDVEYKEAMRRLEELELEEAKEPEQQKEPEPQEAVSPKPFEFQLEDLEEVEEAEENARIIHERLLAQTGVSSVEMQKLLDYLDACESSEEEYDDEEEEEELDSDDYASDEDEDGKEKSTENEQKEAPKVVEITETSQTTTKTKKSLRFARKLEEVKTFLESDRVEIKESTPPEAKSILRSKEPTPVDRSALEPEHKELEPMSSTSFPGEIVEKNPYICEPSTSKDPAPVIKEAKVSKFRASRNRNS